MYKIFHDIQYGGQTVGKPLHWLHVAKEHSLGNSPTLGKSPKEVMIWKMAKRKMRMHSCFLV